MSDAGFVQAFALLIGHEGGYSDEREDPGNWTGNAVGSGALRGTKYGISAGAYPDLDIAGLTLAQAQDIYRHDYWGRLRCDDLPPPLALLVFDAGVNNGVGRAARWLQVAVGTEVDGELGVETMAALRATLAAQGLQALCTEFHAQRLDFMGGLETWRAFGLGWARRLCALPYQAMAMPAA